MGPGPAPAPSQGALLAPILERQEGGGREGCPENMGFPKEEQRHHSTNAEDAQPEDPGLRSQKGVRMEGGAPWSWGRSR